MKRIYYYRRLVTVMGFVGIYLFPGGIILPLFAWPRLIDYPFLVHFLGIPLGIFAISVALVLFDAIIGRLLLGLYEWVSNRETEFSRELSPDPEAGPIGPVSFTIGKILREFYGEN